MSEWKKKLKHDISVFKTLKRMFEAGAIEKMYDIKDINPAKVADALGINKGRYAYKLAHPETFSTFELLRLSYIIDIDPIIIISVIQNEKEVFEKLIARINKNLSKLKTQKEEKRLQNKKK